MKRRFTIKRIWSFLFVFVYALTSCDFKFMKSETLDVVEKNIEDNSQTNDPEHTIIDDHDVPPVIEFDEFDFSLYEANHQEEKILYSDARLELADFSFKMYKDYNGNHAAKAHKQNKVYYGQKDLSHSKEIVQEVLEEETLESFSIYKHELKSLSEDAKKIVDLAIKKCTILDSLIYFDDYDGCYLMLSYNSEKDIIHVFANIFDTSYNINLFYNNDGFETIEMSLLGHQTGQDEHSRYLLYTPGIQYKLIMTNDINYNYMDVEIADKIDGDWHMMSYLFSSENAYLTGNGIYDPGNGTQSISFGLEVDDAYCYYTDVLTRARNGFVVPGYVEARADDIPLLFTDRIESGPIQASNPSDGIFREWSINLDLFTNIVEFSPVDNMDVSYIKLANGNEITPRSVYSYETGYLRRLEDKSYIDENGNIIYEIPDNYGLTIRAIQNYGYGPDNNILELKLLTGDGLTLPTSNMYSLQLIKDFIDALGLKYDEDIFGNIFSVIEKSLLNKKVLREDLFKHFYNVEYTENNLLDALFKEWDDFSSIKDIHNNYMTNYGLYASYSLPKLNRNSLINLSLNDAAVAHLESGHFNLSSISFTINPSIILREGKKYSAVLFVGNKPIYDLFNVEEYRGSKMNFLGKELSIDNKTIFDTVGLRKLRLVFGLIEGNLKKFVPLSNFVELDIQTFDTFSFETDYGLSIGGYYIVNVSSDNNAINVGRTFIDTSAPIITSYYQDIIEGTKISETITVQDLINSLSIRDNIDGFIPNENVIVLFNGEDVDLESIVVEGTYSFTVSDVSGNVGRLDLFVEIVESIDEDEDEEIEQQELENSQE